MNIQEFYDSIDESYENVSSRKLSNRSRNWIKLDNKKTKMRESFEVV